MRWPSPRHVENLRVVMDIDLNDNKRRAFKYPKNKTICTVPQTLIKFFKVEFEDSGGNWNSIYSSDSNRQRSINISIKREVTALRATGQETWGKDIGRIFGPSVSDENTPDSGISWSEKIFQQSPEDLAAPEMEDKLAEKMRISVSS